MQKQIHRPDVDFDVEYVVVEILRMEGLPVTHRFDSLDMHEI
jgi:hypothetical protein